MRRICDKNSDVIMKHFFVVATLLTAGVVAAQEESARAQQVGVERIVPAEENAVGTEQKAVEEVPAAELTPAEAKPAGETAPAAEAPSEVPAVTEQPQEPAPAEVKPEEVKPAGETAPAAEAPSEVPAVTEQPQEPTPAEVKPEEAKPAGETAPAAEAPSEAPAVTEQPQEPAPADNSGAGTFEGEQPEFTDGESFDEGEGGSGEEICRCGCEEPGCECQEYDEGEEDTDNPEEEVEEGPEEEAEPDLSAAYRGIVKIEVANQLPDYNIPWRAGQFGSGTGTGFMVEPGVFMTNAHVVGNAKRINVSPYADARKIPAKVKFVAHDADLALVEVEDAEAFKDVPYLEFSSEMPKLEDSVRAIGYPIGGNRLSVTRGIVSRIDTTPYAHTQSESHLTVQIDAAINPGNSGGPVLMGDKVVGVAFQGLREANSTGYMIPLPVINRFRKDVQDGHYDHYVKIGAQFFPMENPAMRRHYKLPNDAMGAIVGDVFKGSGADGKLQVGDIVLAVNGLPVDSSAMIELGGERVKLEEMAERSFSGDELTFKIIRDGKETEVKVAPKRIPAADILGNEFDALPRYVHFAGLIFQPLQRGVIEAHQMDPGDFVVEMDDFIRRGGSQSKEDVVVLTDKLADEVNARFDDPGTGIVTKVNGQEVKGLRHLYELLYPKDGKREGSYTTIEFKDAPRPFVIDNTILDDANTRIRSHYNIPDKPRLDSSIN